MNSVRAEQAGRGGACAANADREVFYYFFFFVSLLLIFFSRRFLLSCVSIRVLLLLLSYGYRAGIIYTYNGRSANLIGLVFVPEHYNLTQCHVIAIR